MEQRRLAPSPAAFLTPEAGLQRYLSHKKYPPPRTVNTPLLGSYVIVEGAEEPKAPSPKPKTHTQHKLTTWEISSEWVL